MRICGVVCGVWCAPKDRASQDMIPKRMEACMGLSKNVFNRRKNNIDCGLPNKTNYLRVEEAEFENGTTEDPVQ